LFFVAQATASAMPGKQRALAFLPQPFAKIPCGAANLVMMKGKEYH
jgi:hypothetical protein